MNENGYEDSDMIKPKKRFEDDFFALSAQDAKIVLEMRNKMHNMLRVFGYPKLVALLSGEVVDVYRSCSVAKEDFMYAMSCYWDQQDAVYTIPKDEVELATMEVFEFFSSNLIRMKERKENIA
jgi:hypothetical protein